MTYTDRIRDRVLRAVNDSTLVRTVRTIGTTGARWPATWGDFKATWRSDKVKARCDAVAAQFEIDI